MTVQHSDPAVAPTEPHSEQLFSKPEYTMSEIKDKHNWRILFNGKLFLKISKRTNSGESVRQMLHDLNKNGDGAKARESAQSAQNAWIYAARQEHKVSKKEKENKALLDITRELESKLKQEKDSADKWYGRYMQQKEVHEKLVSHYDKISSKLAAIQSIIEIK